MTPTMTSSETLGHARHLHHAVFDLEVLRGETWQPFGTLVVTPDMLVHDEVVLGGAAFHRPTNSLTFSRGATADRGAGRLHFTDSGRALVGTLSNADGGIDAVRATLGYDEVFDTRRRPTGEGSTEFAAWSQLEIITKWQDDSHGVPELVVTYRLGDEDVSDRTRVTKVNHQTGETTLEMVAGVGLDDGADRFDITIAFGGKTFSGTYTDEDGNVFDWLGSLKPAAVETLTRALRRATPALLPEATVRLAVVGAPAASLSVQDLDNVTSLSILTDAKGKEMTVDQAQTKAGEFFNKCLVNALDDKWVEQIFGQRYSLPAGVTTVYNDNQAFFKGHAVLATGTMLKSTFATDQSHKQVIAKISQPKIDAAWKGLGTDPAVAPDYQKATAALYLQGYADGVAGIQPYLKPENDPHQWGKAYRDYLTDPATLLTWQIQLASSEFNNIKGRMYEWYTKLSVLAPNETWGRDMLATAYGALLGVTYSKVRWSEDIKPFLQATLDQALAGKVDFSDQLTKQAADETLAILRDMVSTTDTTIDLVDAMSDAMTIWQNKNPNQSLLDYFRHGNDIVDDTARRLVDRSTADKFKAWGEQTGKERAGGAIKGLLFMAGAGFVIYSIAANGGKQLTPKEVVEEINMGVLALAMTLKGVQAIFTLGVGRKLADWAGEATDGFRGFAKNIAEWFAKDGSIEAETGFGKFMKAVFTENVGEFIGRRLGPVLAVFGIVMSAWFLADAIKSGDVRDIVFETFNTFFALADAVFIGLDLLSFAWAGPVGLVIAVVGLVVALVQLIWNLASPPAPPPDPIEQFVDGPLTTAQLTT